MNLVDFMGHIASSVTGASDRLVRTLSTYIIEGAAPEDHDLVSNLSVNVIEGAAAEDHDLVSNLSIYVIES